MRKIILLHSLILSYSVATSQGGISIVHPLKANIFFSDHAGTMVPGLIKIDFSGNTSTQLGFSPTFTGTKQVSCESPAGSGTFSAPIAMALTNGVGFLPCGADKDYSGQIASTSVIKFKIGIKTFTAIMNTFIPEFDQGSAHTPDNNAFAGAAPIVDVSNLSNVIITLTEGPLYQAAQLLATYNDFYYSVVYQAGGEHYVLEGSLSGPYIITEGGTVEVILGQDIADLIAEADAGSVKITGYFSGTPAAGKAHMLLTAPILLN